MLKSWSDPSKKALFVSNNFKTLFLFQTKGFDSLFDSICNSLLHKMEPSCALPRGTTVVSVAAIIAEIEAVQDLCRQPNLAQAATLLCIPRLQALSDVVVASALVNVHQDDQHSLDSQDSQDSQGDDASMVKFTNLVWNAATSSQRVTGYFEATANGIPGTWQ